MKRNIDQQIYDILLANANGVQENIKDVSRPTLIKMKNGKFKTSFQQLFEILLNNGISKISLFSDGTQMDVYPKKKSVEAITRKL